MENVSDVMMYVLLMGQSAQTEIQNLCVLNAQVKLALGEGFKGHNKKKN